jgi:GTP cyclohydrolase I
MEAAEFDEACSLVRRLLQLIGDDPNREGLLETPARVVRSWSEIYSGYSAKCEDYAKVFEHQCDEIVMLRGLNYYSQCEHHMLPFFGTCTIAYLPDQNRVLGVSKLARMLEVFSRRLQLQERLTDQLANGIQEAINPRGVAVYIDGHHMCMSMRGVHQTNTTMRTHKLLGSFLTDSNTRAELMSLMSV